MHRMDFLKRRAMAFLESARADLNRGDHDLVLFHVEQFLQLYLKHLIYKKVGDYPKTHSLIRLIKIIIEVYNDEKIKEFYERYLETLYLLEEAYISSRYLPRDYDEEIAERILNFAEIAKEVLEWLEGI